MTRLLTGDNLLLAVLLVAVFAATLVVCCDSTEGALPRYLAGRRYHRAGRGRHVRRDAPTPDAPASEVEEAPEGFPWAPPAALATIPDPLTTARTA